MSPSDTMYSRGLYLEKSKVETRASDSVVCPPKNRNMSMDPSS